MPPPFEQKWCLKLHLGPTPLRCPILPPIQQNLLSHFFLEGGALWPLTRAQRAIFLRYDHSKQAFSMHFNTKSNLLCSPKCPTIMCSSLDTYRCSHIAVPVHVESNVTRG